MKNYEYMESMKAIEDLVWTQINSMSKDVKKPTLAYSCLQIISRGHSENQDPILDDIIGDTALRLMEHQSRIKVALIEIDGEGKYIYPDFYAPLKKQDNPDIKTDLRRTTALLECRKQIANTIDRNRGVQWVQPFDGVLEYTEDGEEYTPKSNLEKAEVLADQTGHYLPGEEWETVKKVLDTVKVNYPKQLEDCYRVIRCMVNGMFNRNQIAEHLELQRNRVDYVIRTFTSVYHKLNENNRREVSFIKIPTWERGFVEVPDGDGGTYLEEVQIPTTTYHKVTKKVFTSVSNGKKTQTTRYYDAVTGAEMTPKEKTRSKGYVIDKGIVAKSKPHWHTVYSPSSTVYRGVSFSEVAKVNYTEMVNKSYYRWIDQTNNNYDRVAIMEILTDRVTDASEDSKKALAEAWELYQSKPGDKSSAEWDLLRKAGKRYSKAKDKWKKDIWTGSFDDEVKPGKERSGCRAVMVYVPEIVTDSKGYKHISSSPICKEVTTVLYYDGIEIDRKTGLPKEPKVNRIRKAWYDERAKRDNPIVTVF